MSVINSKQCCGEKITWTPYIDYNKQVYVNCIRWYKIILSRNRFFIFFVLFRVFLILMCTGRVLVEFSITIYISICSFLLLLLFLLLLYGWDDTYTDVQFLQNHHIHLCVELLRTELIPWLAVTKLSFENAQFITCFQVSIWVCVLSFTDLSFIHFFMFYTFPEET